jgi:hypothetical protein
VPAAPPAPRAKVVAAAAALADASTPAVEAAERALLAAADPAWPLLLERFRRESPSAPDRLVRLLGRLARTRSQADRDSLRYALASMGGDTWHAPMMSMSSGRGTALSACHVEVYGELAVDAAAPLDDMVAWLEHKCVAVRLASARALATRSADVAAATDSGQRVRQTLVDLATADLPANSPFQTAPHDEQELPCDLTAPLRAAVALALVDCDAPAATQRVLLPLVLAATDEARVVAAVRKFAPAANRADLERAAADPRAAVAAAARDALAALPPGDGK